MIHSNQAQSKLNVDRIEVICATNKTTREVGNILQDLTQKSFSSAEIRRLGQEESTDTISYSEGLLKISCSGRKESGRYKWNVSLIPRYIL
ncbi:hypothetical protein Xen7305DRAFT_00039460 [Xenococcus sp. PCC 7305]|uniref:hypothetical protein n=1 Tax=Xenococcus sp. PCC 7305 TaxID=102125 RepID=UPI0002AB9D4C|nr:hypothetical protein [Xenococcus sp. PCC 7305]ELS04218.1 hypothetical protein Xen7305DRAFT_00039460 [Xenococcus sp. PCC 7305]